MNLNIDSAKKPSNKSFSKSPYSLSRQLLVENPKFQRAINQYFSLLEVVKEENAIRQQITTLGEYGWTVIPIPDKLCKSYMDVSIDSFESVDNYFLGLLDNETINFIFSEIKEKDNDNRDDILEAIRNYYDKRYKSSALIMFGLIDKLLINSQGDVASKKKVGNCAATEMMNYFENNAPSSFYFYRFWGLKSCLHAFFKSAENFRISEFPINRNMLVHGMFQRKVEKKDCLQLFLFYRNLISYISDFMDKFYTIRK